MFSFPLAFSLSFCYCWTSLPCCLCWRVLLWNCRTVPSHFWEVHTHTHTCIQNRMSWGPVSCGLCASHAVLKACVFTAQMTRAIWVAACLIPDKRAAKLRIVVPIWGWCGKADSMWPVKCMELVTKNSGGPKWMDKQKQATLYYVFMYVCIVTLHL